MPDKQAKEIGRRIWHYRVEKAHLTQEELAKKADLKANTISRLEGGHHRASSLTLEKLAKALGVRVGDFY